MNKKYLSLCVLLMVICLAGGVAIGYTLSNKNSENTVTGDNNKENVDDNNVENNNNENSSENLLTVSDFFDNKCMNENCNGNLDKNFALNLISKYIHNNNGGTRYNLMRELSEDYKNDVAASNLIGKKALCQDYFDLYESNCYENDEIKVISYDDLLKKKKELFGENSTLERKDFFTLPLGSFSYFSNIDSFVFKGYEAKDSYTTEDFGIFEVQESKDKVFIALYEIVSGLYYDDAFVYGYTFKKENNNYYLDEITRLRFG